jgi:hypothetical protein
MKSHNFLIARIPMKSPRFIAGMCMFLCVAATTSMAQAPGKIRLAGFTPNEVRTGRATLVGHYDPNQMLRLVIGLQ